MEAGAYEGLIKKHKLSYHLLDVGMEIAQIKVWSGYKNVINNVSLSQYKDIFK